MLNFLRLEGGLHLRRSGTEMLLSSLRVDGESALPRTVIFRHFCIGAGIRGLIGIGIGVSSTSHGHPHWIGTSSLTHRYLYLIRTLVAQRHFMDAVVGDAVADVYAQARIEPGAAGGA